METKTLLLRYLRASRDALIWKAEGLSERDLRLPRTPTGTNLAGLIKHCAFIEHGYFVECFAQSSPLSLPSFDFDADPQADFYLTAEESAADTIKLYRQVGEVVDEIVERFPLAAAGYVPWWGERSHTTLEAVLVHVLAEVARHAGHADIIREGIDESVGLRPAVPNTEAPPGGWPAHVRKLTDLADGGAR